LFDLTTPFGWAGLAGTTFGAALLYAVSGFGFALLAVPLYLLIVDPALAVQFAIIVSTALAIAVVPGLRRTVAPALLLRLSVGNLAGLPIGLFSFRYADPLLVRLGGASYDPRVCTDHGGRSTARRAILAASPSVTEPRSLRWGRCRDRDRTDRDGRTAGADLSAAGWHGGANRARDPSRILALSYGATLAAPAATIGIPRPTWIAAGMLVPFALLGGDAGRPIGDRLGTEGFALLAIGLLTAAGLYTVAGASIGLVTRQP